MDALTVFGLCAVTAMLVFYALEDHSPHFIVAFAAACAAGSIYGFLQGAWPFGVIEAIWALIAAWRWQTRISAPPQRKSATGKPIRRKIGRRIKTQR